MNSQSLVKAKNPQFKLQMSGMSKMTTITPNCVTSLMTVPLPIRGMDSDVSGIFSAMASMKTENAKRTVIPSPIFSPESGGRQKTKTVNVLIIMHGNTMLYLKISYTK